MLNRALILASKSPRRKQLLEEAGFTFEVKAVDTDESYPENITPSQIAEHIAQQKAVASKSLLEKESIIITADTIVAVDDLILGKPKDEQDATQMLQQLSGKSHQVITGVCLSSLEKENIFSVTTHVTFKALSDVEIQFYIKTCQPFDKAGSYAIQEWIGMIGIVSINGCYYNVVGLPVHELYKQLLAF